MRSESTRAIAPDRRWLTKQYLVLATITAVIAAAAGTLHLVLVMALDEDDRSDLGLLIWGIVGAAVLVMWLVAVPIVRLWHKNLSYAIEPQQIVIRKGILTRIQQNIPLDMVTDFRLRRSLYDRALGIGSIHAQTAGQGVAGGGYEGRLAGLEEWGELHEELRGRIRRTSPTDDVDLGDILNEIKEIRSVLEAGR